MKTNDNYIYPVVSYGVSMQEIPDHIAFVINIGNCTQGCEGCHSKDVMGYGNPVKEVPLKKVIKKATKVHKLGATVCCIMGGTTNYGVTRESLTALINALALIFEEGVGLYSGSDDAIDDNHDIEIYNYLPVANNYYYAHYTPLTYLKIGSYQKDLGGLDNPKTNQRYYVKESDGEWHDRTSLFTTMNK